MVICDVVSIQDAHTQTVEALFFKPILYELDYLLKRQVNENRNASSKRISTHWDAPYHNTCFVDVCTNIDEWIYIEDPYNVMKQTKTNKNKKNKEETLEW